jgi:uncharacterized membrane protein YczE
MFEEFRKLKAIKFHQFMMYTLGCVLFSFGAKFFIDSKLGVDPLDVLCIGMTKHLPITIGIAAGIVAIVFLSIWSLWNRKFPPIMPFFTTFIVGNCIDLWNHLHIQTYTSQAFSSYQMLIVGLMLCSYASSFIIMSGIGIRIMDLVSITIVEKWNWSFFQGKMLLEVIMFSIGYVLGGPVGIGTLGFLCLVGTMIQPFMIFNNRYFKLPNHGIAKYNTAS